MTETDLTIEELDALIAAVEWFDTPQPLVSSGLVKLIQLRAGLGLREAMRAHNGFHDCPAGQCPERIPPSLAMCGTHWNRVPARLRKPVWIAADNVKSHPDDPAVRHEYDRATDAALHYLRENELI